MGQQQLIVMILVTVVVGIMTVVAITMFQEAQKESEKSAIRQDLLDCSSMAIAYYKKPRELGGGGGSFLNITFNELGLDTASYNGYYFNIIAQSEQFQVSAATLDRSDTLTAVINQFGIIWN
ncbi:MAG: hypothetical protein RIC57_09005 [Balneola sp.]|jgi:Tfp pilus assembly protein PilE|tara:strand:+ start:115215 stop:115580 length:366 start_codon:yes stop_codon:yes gene_type:complete